MKLGQPPQKVWHSSQELNGSFNRLSGALNRLVILEYVWNQQVGGKARFWVLKAVQRGTLFVQVRVSVARNELLARQQPLIRELNKHFDTPWIKKIEIV